MQQLPAPTAFLDELAAQLLPVTGPLAHLPIDHICYRVATKQEYETLKELLIATNELLTEAPVNGRRIATFRLLNPYRWRERTIELLELPEPKPGSSYPTGWEHAEFVTDRPLAAFVEWLEHERGVPSASIDTKGMGKALNAEVRLRLAGGSSVKFHELPLDEVIRIETGCN